MKIKFALPAAIFLLSQGLFSCQKVNENKQVQLVAGIPNDVINQIQAKGFSTDGIVAVDGGYVVENDIFLSGASLSNLKTGPTLSIAQEEQYRTTNLITRLPRVITVSMSYPSNVALFTAATDSAIARYNALNLRLKFVRVPSGGEIDIIGADLGGGGVLGRSSGFPDANGNPASPITLNSRKGTYTSTTDVQWLATIIAHEMGHTIGMRHTDYRSRSYSCGFSFGQGNEGQADVGAIHIPGTPTSAKDPVSWMLACTDGTNRPFNPNDVIALNYLYK